MNKTTAASNQEIYYRNIELSYKNTKTYANIATQDFIQVKERVSALACMIFYAIRESVVNAFCTPAVAVIGSLNLGIQLYNYLSNKQVTVETEKAVENIPSETVTASEPTSQYRIELSNQPEERHLKPVVEESANAAPSEAAEEKPFHLDTLFAEPAEVTKDAVEEKQFEVDDVQEEAEKFVVSKNIDAMVVKVAKCFGFLKTAA